MDYIEKLVKDAFVDNEAYALFTYASENHRFVENMAELAGLFHRMEGYSFFDTNGLSLKKEIIEKISDESLILERENRELLSKEGPLRDTCYNQAEEFCKSREDFEQDMMDEIEEFKQNGILNKTALNEYKKSFSRLIKLGEANEKVINFLHNLASGGNEPKVIDKSYIYEAIRSGFGGARGYRESRRGYFSSMKDLQMNASRVAWRGDASRMPENYGLISQTTEKIMKKAIENYTMYIDSRVKEIWG